MATSLIHSAAMTIAADVRLVHLHRTRILSGLPGQRLLRYRQPGSAQSRHAPLQWKEIHHDRREPVRKQYSRAIGQTEREELDKPVSPLRRIEKRRHAAVHDGTTAEQGMGSEITSKNIQIPTSRK